MSNTSRVHVEALAELLRGEAVEYNFGDIVAQDLREAADVLEDLRNEVDKVQNELEKLQGDYRGLLFKYSSMTLD